jgi:hypothetical protein
MSSSEARKAWFQDYLRDWVETTLRESFDSLKDVRRSKLMSRFFAEKVLGPRNPALLPFAEEDLDACVVDGNGRPRQSTRSPLSACRGPRNPRVSSRFHGSVKEGITMSRVERIEGDVQNLTAEELKAFRDWFTRFDAAAWDNQIEADAADGKLRALADRALKDHKAGRSTVL